MTNERGVQGPTASTPDPGGPAPRRARGLVAAGLTAGLVAVGLAGGSAMVGATTDEAVPPVAGATTETTTASTWREQRREAAAQHLRDVLAPLVEDGTLTDDQVDAILERLSEHRAEVRDHRLGDRAEVRRGSGAHGQGPHGPGRSSGQRAADGD